MTTITPRIVVCAVMDRLSGAVELLDGPLDDRRALVGNLRDLARFNRRLGGIRLTTSAVDALAPGSAPLTVLDVGTGGADIPLALIERGRAEGRLVRVTGIDNRPEVLAAAAVADPRVTGTGELALHVGDGARPPLPRRRLRHRPCVARSSTTSSLRRPGRCWLRWPVSLGWGSCSTTSSAAGASWLGAWLLTRAAAEPVHAQRCAAVGQACVHGQRAHGPARGGGSPCRTPLRRVRRSSRGPRRASERPVMSQRRRCRDRRRGTGRDHPGGRAGEPRDRGAGPRAGAGLAVARRRRVHVAGRRAGAGAGRVGARGRWTLSRDRSRRCASRPRAVPSARLTYGADRGGPSAVGFDRSRLDPALEALARDRGVAIRRGARVSAVELDPDGVATLRVREELDPCPDRRRGGRLGLGRRSRGGRGSVGAVATPDRADVARRRPAAGGGCRRRRPRCASCGDPGRLCRAGARCQAGGSTSASCSGRRGAMGWRGTGRWSRPAGRSRWFRRPQTTRSRGRTRRRASGSRARSRWAVA